MKKDLIRWIIFSMILLTAVDCNPGKNDSSNSDTGNTSSGIDSMPVVKPQVNDGGNTIITPPVNDSNAIIPDTNENK